jgi:hypothetical protein
MDLLIAFSKTDPIAIGLSGFTLSEKKSAKISYICAV